MFAGTFAMVGRAIVLGQPPTDFANLAPTVIRHAELNPDTPIFVPVHPRIATTISFPRPIGEPLGTGFIDAENIAKTAAANAKAPPSARGEYVIDYEQGDTFFTVQPTARSELLNLNVPFEGATIVFYFYPVQSPLSALASLIVQEKSAAHEPTKPAVAVSVSSNLPSDAPIDRIQKSETAPVSKFVAATPARLDGFLRKLRMVHAAQRGPELDELASALKVAVSTSTAESPGTAASAITHPVNDCGLYQLLLLRAVRDSALDAVGFVVLMRNTSDQVLVFDPRTFSARCGAALYSAQVIDAPATLKPHETQAAYFAIVGAGDGRPGYLEADNDWRISVALVSPRLPPGATLSPEHLTSDAVPQRTSKEKGTAR
jgi:hypothetical protein